jgi:2-octaprenyl-6-methoxyphenol hydroxylase
MVWCMPSALVSARAGLSETQRCDAIGEALGPRWGRPQAVGSAAVFPLFTHRVDRVCEGQSVRIGNAAQTLHPVAGQGFNLGLRDAATLVDCVVAARRSALANNRPIDWPLALEAYQRRRRNDRWLLPKLTSALPGIFAHRSVFASAARSVGLLGLDLLPPARRGLGRLLMLGGE